MTRFAALLEETFEMAADEAHELGEVVLDQFAGTDEVDDEQLDTDLRSVFYTLEAKRILAFRRVEYTREDGDHRRAFYWRLRPEAFDGQAHTIPVSTADDVYSNLPATAWQHAA